MRDGDSRRVQLWRPFIEEGFERLSNVEFIIETSEPGASPLFATHTASAFQEKWLELLSSLDSSDLAGLRTRVSVPRASVMAFILDVMVELVAMHAAGKVHGDLKPSNILVSRNGPTLIDEAGVAFGDVSPTVSIGWSPPEQLLREPLTLAADIYPLGEIVQQVLQAESLGRRVIYRMPGGRDAELCENPTIYMDPASEVLPLEGRTLWYAVLERALAARPSERWESVEAMANAIGDAMRCAPIATAVDVGGTRGVSNRVLCGRRKAACRLVGCCEHLKILGGGSNSSSGVTEASESVVWRRRQVNAGPDVAGCGRAPSAG
jgi:serine/threonine protein kinase